MIKFGRMKFIYWIFLGFSRVIYPKIGMSAKDHKSAMNKFYFFWNRFAGEHLFNLFRPEFVKNYHTPLCSDAFSGFLNKTERESINKNIGIAHNYLVNNVIPSFCSELDKAPIGTMNCDEFANHSFAVQLHKNGINYRYLGMIWNKLTNPRWYSLFALKDDICTKQKNDFLLL